MKKLIFILSLIWAVNSANADVLYLNQGEEHVGNLKEITESEVSFESLQSRKIETFATKDIAHILLSKTRTGDEINYVKDITEPIVRKVLENLPNPALFQNSDYVTLYRATDIEYISETEITYKNREITWILKEPGLDNANQSFFYNSDNTDFNIDFAHTYSLDGKVYHLTDDALSDESLYNTAPEYAKIRKIKIAMKNVDLGSIIDCSVTRKSSDVSVMNPSIYRDTFGEREPILHEEVNITFPNSMKLEKLEMQWENNTPKFSETSADGKTTWNWVFSDSEGFISEQNMLPLSRIFPRIAIYKKYDKKEIASQLTKAYKEAEASPENLDSFISKIDIDENDTEYEKVCKVYEYLNKELSGIGLDPDDMGSFKPVSANVTITKKYANAQAQLALLHSILNKLGIKSFIGFTDGKREKLTFKDHANLEFATTPILKVVIDNISYYTDGGSIYTPFAVLSIGLQGSTASFLDEEKEEFFDETLPRQTFDWNTYQKFINVKIKDDGSMDVAETTIYRGPYESDMRGLKSLKDKEKSNYAEKRVKSVHPNAVLKSYGFSDMADLNAPAIYSISYTIPNAAQMASDKIMTFTNFWTDYNASSASLAKRKYPMKYWATENTSINIIFELPDGFNWVKWDNQYKYITPEISFTSNLSQNGRQLVYTDRFEANVDEFITDKSYQNYRNCILKMSELDNQWIILEK